MNSKSNPPINFNNYTETAESNFDLASKEVCIFLRKGDFPRVKSMVEAAGEHSVFTLSWLARTMLVAPVEREIIYSNMKHISLEEQQSFSISQKALLQMINNLMMANTEQKGARL
jgi:hypothetical protein